MRPSEGSGRTDTSLRTGGFPAGGRSGDRGDHTGGTPEHATWRRRSIGWHGTASAGRPIASRVDAQMWECRPRPGRAGRVVRDLRRYGTVPVAGTSADRRRRRSCRSVGDAPADGWAGVMPNSGSQPRVARSHLSFEGNCVYSYPTFYPGWWCGSPTVRGAVATDSCRPSLACGLSAGPFSDESTLKELIR